jgi:prepilin peptidase CpaA
LFSTTFVFFVLLLWAAVCAILDARTRQISNLLTYPAALLTIIYIAVTGHTLCNANLTEAVATTLLVLLLTLPGYYRNLFGAGDIKMLLVLALATGLVQLLIIFAIAGLGLLLWQISARFFWSRLPAKIQEQAVYLDYRRSKIAYAPFLFLGLIIALALP